MKKNLLLFLLLILGTSINSFGQDGDAILSLENKANSNQLEEYVLEVPLMESQKVLPVFKNALKQISGVEFKGFCESRRLLFIKANLIGFQQMIDLLRDMQFEFYRKEDSNHKQAKNSCGSIEEIEATISTY